MPIAEDLFSSIEAPLTQPVASLPQALPSTRIYISGPLAEYAVDQDAALRVAHEAPLSQRIRFAVEVDARDGMIHWYEPLVQTADTILAEKVLQALVF